MYATLQEIVLVHPSKARVYPDDLPIFLRDHPRGEKVFCFDGAPSAKYDVTPPQRAGIAYIDANYNLCVVPDEWNEDDAMCAKSAVWPDLP